MFRMATLNDHGFCCQACCQQLQRLCHLLTEFVQCCRFQVDTLQDGLLGRPHAGQLCQRIALAAKKQPCDIGSPQSPGSIELIHRVLSEKQAACTVAAEPHCDRNREPGNLQFGSRA